MSARPHAVTGNSWRNKLPHLLLITLFGLPLTLNNLLNDATVVACTHDGHLHYHRVTAMLHAWQNGVYFSRWMPDLAYGYGYPFFVYREPAPLYAVLWPHLAGLSLPTAENLFYAVCILACGWFMYLWVRDILGSRAALVSGLAYMSAPYILVDAFVRGNAPESLALPLFPLLLWASRRWLLGGQRRWFATAVFALALLGFSHNISLLIFTPTLLIYLVALSWIESLPTPTAVGRIGLFFGLGLGMVLFYVGTAVFEMDAVTLQQSTNTRNNDFRYNFASLAEMLAPVAAEDPTLLNPPLYFRLGWVITFLAALGGVVAWRLPHRSQRWHAWLMILATAVYLFMALDLSALVWEHTPLIEFVQFPWRFIGRAALPLALLAGIPFALWQPQWKWQRPLFWLAFPLLLLETYPNLYPSYCHEEPYPTILTVHQYERETGLVGVDPEGSYFPHSVQQRPTGSPLEADYAAGQLPQRFDSSSLPEGAVLQTAVYQPLSASLQLSSPQPFTATYQTFAFPGWQVKIDGQRVATAPSVPAGLLTFAVPAGNHQIELFWGSTPLRSSLTAVSALAFGLVLALLVGGRRLPLLGRYLADGPAPALNWPQSPLPGPQLVGLLATAVLLMAGKLLIDRVESPWRHSAGPSVSQTLDWRAGELRLAGYTLSQQQVASGGTFDIDLAWTAVEVPRLPYQSNVWLASADGLWWSEKETHRTRVYEDAPSTIFWQPGQWGWDSRELQLLSGTPPGRYDVMLTLFNRDDLQPLTLYDADGRPLGPTAVLGQIEVLPAQTSPSIQPQYLPAQPVQLNGWALLGYNQDRQQLQPGDGLLLSLFWQQLGHGQDEVALQLQAEDGTAVADWLLPLSPTAVPASQTAVDTVLRSQHWLRLGPELADGRYRFWLDGQHPLAELVVQGPERLFEPPPMATAVEQSFALAGEPLAELVGYEVADPPTAVRLLWQATAVFPTSYRVFVHLVDGQGQIVAQADGEPVGWTRPTTGWLPGEYLLDEHLLAGETPLPEGPLWLRIGLYEAETGQRLQTAVGDLVEVQVR